MPHSVSAAFKAVFSQTTQGFALVAAEGTILHASPSTASILGYAPETLAGRNAGDLIHSENQARTLEPVIRELQGSNASATFQCRCRHRDGSWRWLEITATNLLHNPEVEAIAVLFHDITAHKQREAALQEDHTLLHAVVEGATDAIFVKDLQGRYKMINSAGAAFLGKQVDEVIGQETGSLFSSESADRVSNADKQVISTGNPQTIEFSATSAGVERVYRSSRGPFRNHQGNIVGVVGISRDITQEQRAAQALQKAHEELRAVVDAAPVAILALDLEGRITTWNAAAEHIFGWSEPEVIGQLPPFIPDVGEESYLQRLHRAADEGMFSDMEARRLRKDGTEMHASLSVSALRNSAGEVTGYMSVLMDITKRKQAEASVLALNAELEDRVAQRTAQLEAANQELEAFSYSVSHDLRAPLSIISGYAQTLVHFYGANLDAEGHELLDHILTASERMTGLIDALLRLARLSRAQIYREKMDLSVICHEVIQRLRIIEPERTVEIEIPEQLPADADPRLLSAVMDNLLRNAWKFSSKRPVGRIEVGVDSQGSETVYYVRDNGAGFEPEHAHKLFQAFQRLHNSTEFEGTGIGLATVQRIIQRHGGRIWAEGKVDEGAAFYFTLPPERRQ